MTFLDKIPMLVLAALAAYLAVAPYPALPQPHLTEKLGMLLDGTLTKPLDIFDLFLHATPLVLLAMKIGREVRKRMRT